MSTILKALRKIENESDRNDGSPAWPGPVHLKRKEDAKIRNKRKWRQLILGLTILVLACGSAWIYSLQPVKIKKLADEESPSIPITKSVNEERRPVKTEMVSEKEQANKDSRQLNASRETGKNLRLEEDEPGMLKTEGYSESFSRTAKPDLSHARTPSIEDFSENHEKSEVSTAENKIVQKKLHRLAEKRDPRINLQAIAWAPDPKNSFALINNRILHEGASFDGITITHIGKDDVSFREMGNEWREDFRIK